MNYNFWFLISLLIFITLLNVTVIQLIILENIFRGYRSTGNCYCIGWRAKGPNTNLSKWDILFTVFTILCVSSNNNKPDTDPILDIKRWQLNTKIAEPNSLWKERKFLLLQTQQNNSINHHGNQSNKNLQPSHLSRWIIFSTCPAKS